MIAQKLSKYSSNCLSVQHSPLAIGKCVGHQVRMFYKGFDEHITSRFGVVCRAWPLPQFQSPADMATKHEVEIVLHAFKTGTTSFQRLSDAEWRAWDDARFQASIEQMMGPQSEGRESIDHDVETASTDRQAGPSRGSSQGAFQPYQVNAVIAANGIAIDSSTQKKRKKRSDAGVPRGPRNKTQAR